MILRPVTVNGEILELVLFIRWFLGKEKESELFQNIQVKHKDPKLPTDQLLSRSDIQKLVEVCDRSRDRAIIMLMWDSGARIGEIVSLNIGHVEFDRYGAVVIVTGKTGRRRLRLISSVPDIQTWINQQPLKNDPNAPLFVTFHRYGTGTKRLNLHTIQNMLKRLTMRANIGKRVHPHAIRHARLTDLVRRNGGKQGLSEMELRLVAGWEKNSNMPEVYVHLSGADVERKLLENAGLIDDKDNQKNNILEQVRCPRCKAMNAHDAMYCASCSMVLNEIAARKLDEVTETAKVSYEDNDAKKVGAVSAKASTVAGFDAAALEIMGNIALSTAMGGDPVRDSDAETFSAQLKCSDAGGEIYYVTFGRDQVRISSYKEDAIRTPAEQIGKKGYFSLIHQGSLSG